MNAEILKNTRTEEREDRRTGVIRSRVVTTWDLVKDGELISECRTMREAIAKAKEFNRTQVTPDGRTPISAVRRPR